MGVPSRAVPLGYACLLKQCSETSEINILLKKAMQIFRFIFTYDCVWVFLLKVCRNCLWTVSLDIHRTFTVMCMDLHNVHVAIECVICSSFAMQAVFLVIIFDAVLLLFTSVQQCIRVRALCYWHMQGWQFVSAAVCSRLYILLSFKMDAVWLVIQSKTSWCSVLGSTRLNKIWCTVKTNRSWYIR